jgi:hypothetical protein
LENFLSDLVNRGDIGKEGQVEVEACAPIKRLGNADDAGVTRG